MAQESSGLRRDDERTEVHSDLDRDAGLSTTSITDANAYRDDDDTRLTLATDDDDETTADAETAAQTEQIRHEIEETRANMGSTIDAIQERLSIQNISEQVSEQVNSAIESAKESVYEATIGKVASLMKETGRSISSSNIGRTISSNPWPFALIGLGSAWLIYNSRSGNSRRRFNGNGGTRYGERNYLRSHEQGSGYTGQHTGGQQSSTLGGAAEGVSNVAGSAYASVSSTASDAVSTVSNTANQTYNKAADVASRAYDRVGEYGSVAQEKYEEYIETKPLAVAAAAAAVGAAIGLAIPSTRYEGQLVGETRDNLMSKATDAATQLVDKAKEVAGEAGAVLKDEIQSATESTGSTGGSTGGGSAMGGSTTGTGRTGTGGGGGL